jgi:hypothetical protein
MSPGQSGDRLWVSQKQPSPKRRYQLFRNWPEFWTITEFAAGNRRLVLVFRNSTGNPLDLKACYQRDMKDVLQRAGLLWRGWHGFRRGLASNLNRWESMIRLSNVFCATVP